MLWVSLCSRAVYDVHKAKHQTANAVDAVLLYNCFYLKTIISLHKHIFTHKPNYTRHGK